MAYLINPAGRFVAIDDPKEYQRWINEGFKIPTPLEETEHIRMKNQLAQDTRVIKSNTDAGVYLATVSQGGKDGYGIASSLMLDELRKLNISVSTHNTGQKIAMLFHNPYSVLRLEAPYRIIYTMFESDKIPDDWKGYLDAADKVLVPSKWCAEVFKKAGVKTDVVPLGFNEQIFKYKPRENKREARKDFVFLHYNAFNIRKGFLEVFKAFCKAFDKTEPVRMVFKTTLDYIPLPITKSEYPNIDIIRGKCSEIDLANLCYDADCFVFPSRGEGFGLPPLEAMATGIPAIVPNAHGISEYFDPEYMYEAKVKEMCPAIYSRYKGIDVGKMVICDVDQLAEQMRWIYEHQDEAIEKGRKAAKYAQNYTAAKTALHLKQVFDKADKLDLNNRPLKNKLMLEVVK